MMPDTVLDAELLAADTAARTTALTALDRTLLVEAGAGSGKTSVLAGRVAALLASGRGPQEIAAITFTELAAGELRQRVVEFVGELAQGIVRADMRAAFPLGGPDAAQRARLAKARDSLDELLCTTIHGFCQRLLRPYPVEAGMDPGAAVMDRADADAMLAEVLEDWLRERLSGPRRSSDLLVALFVDDARRTGTLVRDLLGWMAHHRGAPVPDVPRHTDPLAALREATAGLRGFLDAAACREEETVAIAAGLEAMLRAAPAVGTEEAEVLPFLLRMAAPDVCAKSDGGWTAYRKIGKWRAAAKASRSAVTAERLHEEAAGHYAACREAHEVTRSYAAGRVLHVMAGELRTVLARFDVAKREAALIDFDDLMVKARDLLRDNAEVCAALSARHAAVLVDEFQDTDRLQSEIFWHLCAATPDPAVPWTEWPLRPGSLFLVGDPKQAIYRFRGADVASYVAARDRLTATDADARVVIGQNFRSLGPILEWVNKRFESPLKASGQPGFEPLFTTSVAPDGHTAVATLPIEVPGGGADAIRDAEAEAVAAFCARVIGALPVRGKDGARPCRPDDIALLAPTGTELWRYERALEAAGIAVSTQAGKGFFRRQEVQDLIALARTLAESSDTLALGALLRGPLVGMTEEALLDATATLPPLEDGTPSRLSRRTPVTDVHDPLLRDTLGILQSLARLARRTTPFVLLCQAVEEMQVRPLLRRRQDRTAERALANLDQFLEAARAYDTRGLPAFARAMTGQWKDAQRSMEGRPDTEQQSVSLVTMHASKGLEWPVVVPVNMGGQLKAQVHAALDAEGRLHLPVFGVRGPGADAALQAERDELERERHRIWYVAATRARDLLLLPAFSDGIPKNSWMERFGLRHDDLEPFDAQHLDEGRLERTEELANGQDCAVFEAEAALIAARTQRIERITPHLKEGNETIGAEQAPLPPSANDPMIEIAPPRGSLARGLVLHKLLEEILTGEMPEDLAVLETRAVELAAQLDDTPGAAALDGAEAARTVLRGLALPPIRAVRDRLVPECTVASSVLDGEVEWVTLGIADAVVRGTDGTLDLVVDWKSDVDPAPATIAQYRGQVGAYLMATNVTAGIIVFLTPGQIEHVRSEKVGLDAALS
jgi:ATP-dependent exoDNAse (exonuclease V) beta subunit